MKQKEAVFKVGDLVRVSSPTMGINIKPNEEKENLDVDQVILVGDECLIVSEIIFLKKAKEYLYEVLTENNLDTKMFNFSSDQLELYED